MLSQDNSRFECVEEPFGTWMIWDNAHDQPAELGALPLIGLPYGSATTLCVKLNDPLGRPELEAAGPKAAIIAENLW
jgi:hypothetical protein